MSSEVSLNKCRTCLTENDSQLFNWNTLIDYEHLSKMTYRECFNECTRLNASLDDVLPQSICHRCASELQKAYCFITKAKQANETLIREQKNVLRSADSNRKDVEGASFEWVAVQKTDLEVGSIGQTPPNDASPRIPQECETDMLNEGDSSSVGNCDSIVPPLQSNDIKSETTSNESKPCGRKRGRPKTNRRPDASMKCNTESQKRVGCEMCGEIFSPKELKKHLASHHKRQILLCHACPRTFKDASTLRQHSQTHEENRVRNYTCDQCDRKFFTKTAYQNHCKTHDTNRKPTFQCNQCDKSFFHKGSLKLHMQRHTGETVECKICSKRYLRQIDLEIHLRSHSGDTPYKCQYCEKSFAQIGILNKHVRYHEGYRYKCDVCLKEYLHQSTLIQHRKEHTGLPLKCSLCEKGFVKKSKLKRHIGGVHKIRDLKEMEEFIIKVKTKREYRGRILETE